MRRAKISDVVKLTDYNEIPIWLDGSKIESITNHICVPASEPWCCVDNCLYRTDVTMASGDEWAVCEAPEVVVGRVGWSS